MITQPPTCKVQIRLFCASLLNINGRDTIQLANLEVRNWLRNAPHSEKREERLNQGRKEEIKTMPMAGRQVEREKLKNERSK